MTRNTRALWAFGVALSILALTLGGACKKKEASPSAKSGTATSAAGKSAETPVTKGASTAAPKGGDDSSEFAALFARYKNVEARVDYEISFTGPAAGSGTMTMRQLSGRTRIDFASPQGTFTLIQLPDKSYICFSDQKTCIESPAGAGPGGPAANPILAAVENFNKNAAGYSAKQLDRRRIAGIEGRCFEFSGPGGVSGVTCVGPDGQLLLAESTSSGTTSKMTATKVEGKPPASDFEPPYPVTALPGGLGGFGPPPR